MSHVWLCAFGVVSLFFQTNDTVFNDIKQWRTQEFCLGGDSTNSVEDRAQREPGSGGGSPLVKGSGVSCNLVQEI